MRIKESSILRAYASLTTAVLLVLIGRLSQEPQDASRFQEITVERINVVDSDGSMRIVIANRERLPDPVVNGVVGPRSSSHPGFLFYNDEGDECGGLVFSGGGESASTSLLFDRCKQDQTVGLTYSEWNKVLDERRRINAIEDDAQRKAAIETFLDELGYPDPFGSQRLFVGREASGAVAREITASG
ncbi:MAG: hypothetical protein GY711_18785 [bacterium]|nr:hypothetical protein [bacterium]